jgi:hypothetical protein
LFPLLTAGWLHLVLYFSTEYHNSRQNIIIVFLKNLVDIWDLGVRLGQVFLGFHKSKLVCSVHQPNHYIAATFLYLPISWVTAIDVCKKEYQIADPF